ncbi:MAG TPA: LuxR family transcriptional regulator [Candidatus Binatia bacterium]|nr:LuxR family transcriptional regulator [Candidatus Binatia bacterium]
MIGRDRELAVIEDSLAAPPPRTIVIEGGAGIGKTTVWSAAAEVARHDRTVLAWRVSAAEQDLAFATLHGLLGDTASRLLGRVPEPRARALAAAFGLAEPDAAAGPGRWPGRRPDAALVGLGVVDVLRALVAEAPLVLALDDVQWSDRASDQVLAFATRRLGDVPVTLLLARRTGDDAGRAPDLVTAMAPERRSTLELGPLSVGALGRLLHERLGAAYPRPLLVRLHDAVAGNPLLAIEVGRSLLARGLELTPGEPFPVPPEAGPLLRDHLATLSRDARRAVLVVAISSDPTPALVEAVVGPNAEAAIDEAIRHGVLVEAGDGLRAAHPLFASTAYADAPPGERRALRRRLAELTTDPVEAAVHLASSTQGPNPTIAGRVADAASVALDRGAPATAADLFRRAADLSVDAEARNRYRIAEADAAFAAGDADRAVTRLDAVLTEVPRGRLRAEAIMGRAEISHIAAPADVMLVALALDDAAGDPLLEAKVHLYVAAHADDEGVALANANRVVEILEQPGVDPDTDFLACALLERAFHLLMRGESAPVADVDRALALLERRASSFFSRRAEECAQRCLYMLGRLEEAIAIDEAEHRRLVDRGHVGLLPVVLQPLATVQLFVGHVAEARRLARELHELVDQGEAVWRDRALLVDAWILLVDGDLDGVRRIGTEALARQQADTDRWEAMIWLGILGTAELCVPAPGPALDYLRQSLELAIAMGVDPARRGPLYQVVEAAVLAGEVDLAEDILATWFEPSARRLGLPEDVEKVARSRGLVELARGNLEAALAAFDEAVSIFEAGLALPLDHGRARLARAQARRRAGRHRAAREDLEAALGMFESLGARAWIERTRTELGHLGGRAPSTIELTAAERRVAELAASGRSNREIAAELVVSVRTVESQLSAAYAKLGIDSRRHLPAALAAQVGRGQSR